MGTSSSSKGSPANVPIVPPWVPPLPPLPPPAPDGAPQENPQQPAPEAPAATNTPAQALPAARVPMAPQRRFAPARSAASRFAASGSARDMKRSVGRYVRSGYGGASTTTQRLGGTISNAGALYSVLAPSEATAGAEPTRRIDRALLAGRSANEIMDAVVEAVRPVDGTQDSEASRKAIKVSLSDVLERYPDANLLELTEEQRGFAIERYVALDVFQRYCLDIGKTIQDNAPNSTAVLSRLKDIREYIRETVTAAFRKLRTAGQTLSARRISQIVSAALLQACQTFEQDGI